MKKGFILLGISSIALVCCNNTASKDALVLYRKSNAYIERNNTVKSFPLSTYHLQGEGDVPYVSLKEFLPIVRCIDSGFKSEESILECSYNNDKYIVSYALDNKHPLKESFIFDKNNQSVTINKDAKAFYHSFYDNDPYIDHMDHIYKAVKEKDKDISLSNNRVIDLNKYDLRLIERNNDLYAPIDLYQVVFKMSMSPTGGNHITYNGIDYFDDRGTNIAASCYSSNLNFNLQDPDILLSIIKVTPMISTDVTFSFSPASPINNEKYRFESSIIKGKEVTIIATEEKYTVPDFFIRISLDNEGKGKYSYINNDTKEEFFNDDIGLTDNKTITYNENSDYINLTLTYPDILVPDSTQSITSSINKNKTFYLQEERSKEYALYDYKILSLYLGEYYGLVESNPKVRDSTNFLKYYKNDILSPKYHDYHLAMSKMALEGIDDAHTKVLGFSKFSKDNVNCDANQKALDDMLGPRRKGILKYSELVKGYREAKGLSQGYEVVNDTAYLSFDGFAATLGKRLSEYTDSPNSYVNNDTIGFTYTALKDIATNHQEVKRVVFDLTCNTGGMIIALPFLLGLMKRDFHFSTYNYYVNDMCQRHYQMDLNGNGVYGEIEDSYEGQYDFYILTSNCSFSCGNAFPCTAKSNKAAKIIGIKSAGGGSVVDYFTSPCGYELRCSSCLTLAYEYIEDSFIENDDGIPVDYEISEQYWYDRALLNTKIDELEGR